MATQAELSRMSAPRTSRMWLGPVILGVLAVLIVAAVAIALSLIARRTTASPVEVGIDTSSQGREALDEYYAAEAKSAVWYGSGYDVTQGFESAHSPSAVWYGEAYDVTQGFESAHSPSAVWYGEAYDVTQGFEPARSPSAVWYGEAYDVTQGFESAHSSYKSADR